MDKNFGLYIVWGILVGAIFGVSLSPASGNLALGALEGAIAGIFIGWFIAAAVKEKSADKSRQNPEKR